MKSASAGRDVPTWAQGLPQHGLGVCQATAFSCFKMTTVTSAIIMKTTKKTKTHKRKKKKGKKLVTLGSLKIHHMITSYVKGLLQTQLSTLWGYPLYFSVPPYAKDRQAGSHQARGKTSLFLIPHGHSREAQAALGSSLSPMLCTAPHQGCRVSPKQACVPSAVFTIQAAKFCHNQSSINPKDCLLSQTHSFHLR